MLILPTAQSPNGGERARKLLADVADQRIKCTLVVFRDGDGPREVASRADVRAAGHPFRQVVWIPDPSVLAGDARFGKLTVAEHSGDEVVALTIRFEFSSRLRGAPARSFYSLERAFAQALAGQVEP